MPRIGLLSDSHGHLAPTQQAVRTLLDHGAARLIHLGDVGSMQVIDALAGLADALGRPIPVHLVFGNTDWDAPSLATYARSLGIDVAHPQSAGRIMLEDQSTLAFTHGHDARAIQLALAQGCQYLCQGHTHQASDSRHGATRWLNPGALHRSSSPSAAILDTLHDEFTLYPIVPTR